MDVPGRWQEGKVTPPYGVHHPNRVKINALGEAQNWRCAYCGIRCDGGQDEHNAATRDHIVPKCKGGFEVSDWGNEVMACLLCNNHRGAMWARQYFQMVQWKGREKAAKWALRRRAKRQQERANQPELSWPRKAMAARPYAPFTQPGGQP